MRKDYTLPDYLALWVFGLAFGLIEAAVVVYLREIFGIGDDGLFPLASGLLERELLVMRVELQREVATLVLMLVPAFLFSRVLFLRFLAYMFVFGLWDLSYYGFLRLFLGWPEGLFTYDVLFLLPTVWVAPVLCPALVALAMVILPSLYFYHARIRMVRLPALMHWLLAIVGGGLVLTAFMKDASYYLGGGLPPRFAWAIFLTGYVLAVGAGAHFVYRYARQSKNHFI